MNIDFSVHSFKLLVKIDNYMITVSKLLLKINKFFLEKLPKLIS